MNTLHRRNQWGRSGFTLIELLIVIAIIAVLLALLTAGVMSIFGRTAEFQARTEIGQLDAAITAAKADLGAGRNIDYLPSQLKLSPTNNWGNTQLDLDSIATLQKLFGRNINLSANNGLLVQDWTGEGKKGDLFLEGHELLVFYLGGIPNVDTGNNTITMTGFSNDPQYPTKVGGTRKGPYYDYKSNRLQRSANGFWHYLDPFSKNFDPDTSKPKTGIPYAYLSCGKAGNDYNATGDCPSIPLPNVPATSPLFHPLPYYTSTTPITQYVNPKGYQIISAGPNKTFGPGGLWDPKKGVSGPGEDDLANFATRKLGATGN